MTASDYMGAHSAPEPAKRFRNGPPPAAEPFAMFADDGLEIDEPHEIYMPLRSVADLAPPAAPTEYGKYESLDKFAESYESFADPVIASATVDPFLAPLGSSAAASQSSDVGSVLLRLLGFAGLMVIAVVHYKDLGGKMKEVPYMGWMYIGLIVSCGAIACLLMFARDHSFAWQSAIALSLATFVGYCISRTTGLPNATDDIGNWSETLGVYALAAEGSVVLIGLMALGRLRRRY